MDGDNNMYGRYGSFPGRSSFLDSIPPFPWMRPDNTAGHYPTAMEDPRLKLATHFEDPRLKAPHVTEDPRLKLTSHFEDPRLKAPHVTEDPRLKLTSHLEDPRLKSPAVMDDPRLKPPLVLDDPRLKPPANAYPLFLEGPGVAPQPSRYYNEIPLPNEAIYSNNYDSHSQSSIVHYSSKGPTSQYRDPHKDQTISRQPAYYNELSKEASLIYDNHCQYSTAKNDTSDPAAESYHENFRKGSMIGPFTLGYAASPYQTSAPNLGNSTESCPEEVIEKALVSHTLEQSNDVFVGNKSSSVENNNGKQIIESDNLEKKDNDVSGCTVADEDAVNLSKDAEDEDAAEKQSITIDTVAGGKVDEDDDKTDSYIDSEKGDPDEDDVNDDLEDCLEGDKSTDTMVNKTSKSDDQEEEENEKQSKCIETQTTINVQQTRRKRNPAIDSKSLAAILGKLNAKVMKSDAIKSDESKSDEQKIANGNLPTRVIKIIKCFKDKNGKFTPKEHKCKLIIQQKIQTDTRSGSTVQKSKSINGKNKVIIKADTGSAGTVKKGKRINRKNESKKLVSVTVKPKVKKCMKKDSDTNEDISEETIVDGDKDVKDTKTLPEPKVIVVQPTPPKKSTKLLSEEEPTAFIHDNDSYSNATILSLTTVPSQLFLGASGNSEHGIGVFCKKDIQRGTRFGPVRGEKLMFQDISPGADFTHIWCYSKDDDWRDIELIDTSNENQSNWCRYIRPSLNSNCNLIRLKKDNQLYFMSNRQIKPGEELVYYLRYFGGDSTGPHHSASFPEKINEDESPSHCTHCKLTLSNAVNYIKHCQIYHTTGSGKTRSHCRLCNAVFLSRRELKKHSKAYHSGHGGEFICAVCGKTYVYQTDLKEHMKLCHYEEPTECDECGKIMLNPKKLQAHKQRAHSRQTFECEKCGKIFTQNSVLQRHRMIHEEVYTVACDRCGKLFRDKHNLKVHLLTHSGVKPFECSIQGCTAAFTVKQCLQGHYRKAHGYTDFNMPPISRSVPFTPDAYMGQQEDMHAIPSLKF